jgi:FkbM family methyltransferase
MKFIQTNVTTRNVDSAQFPLVTIGLPVFNGAATLAAALETLVRQDYPNLKIIISDNASTDGTLAICEEFACKDSRIRIIRKQVNEGAVVNFRTVLDAAEGQFFMWAAADDYWYPQFISRLLPELQADPSAGVALCAVDRRFPDGSLFDLIRFTGNNNPNGMGHLRLLSKILSGAKYNLFIYGLFRTPLLQRAMQCFPEVLGGDRQFICQLALACRFTYVDDVLLTRTHQPKNADAYMRTMGQRGTLRLQLLSFADMTLRSDVIPWWRKAWLPVALTQYFIFGIRQKRTTFASLSMMKRIARKYYLSPGFLAKVIGFLVLVIAFLSLLAYLGVMSSGASATISWVTLLLVVFGLLNRRWIIQSQKTLQQGLADSRQEQNQAKEAYLVLLKESHLTRGQLNALMSFIEESKALNKNPIHEQLAGLSAEDKLSLAESFSVRAKLDYSATPIYLLLNSISEYPRRLACQKEPWTVKWIETYVKEGDVLFDVGANVGAYSLIAAMVTKGNARIFAFEPAFFNYPALCRNVLTNNCQDSIVTFPFALSKSTHLDYFNYADMKAGSALHTLGEQIDYRGDSFDAEYRQPVIAYSLDDMVHLFNIPVPNHIKIDVDGTEMDVLMGAEKTLDNPCVISMMVEISERRAPASTIMSFLQPKGWSLAERYDRPGKPGQSDVSYLLLLHGKSHYCPVKS